jgi:8-oxo-dGTP pyrophosphatase MutT (NUDIX family)
VSGGGTVKPWRRLDAVRLERCRVFDLDRVRFSPPDGSPPRSFFVVDAPDWVNVVALTPERRVVFVRQFRFGIDSITLEIPGGMCDGGEDPREAGGRELLEETGYLSEEMVDLGWVHPNPAVQTNRCHTFLARNALKVAEPRPDPDESFETVTVPIDEIPALVRNGVVTHALVVAAFYKLGLA